MSQLGDKPVSSAEDTTADPVWNCDEIERLYRQALDAMEAVSNDLSSVSQTLSIAAESDAEHDNSETIESTAATSAAPSGDVARRAWLADPASSVDEENRPDPAHVVEALLFVGGQPLTVKTICTLLRGDFDADFVERAIDEIGRRYLQQNRPYEIRLGEGGYRIILRPEFEPLRNRVYGFGPKQVRLSQETLEILALVAYRQPITRRKAEEIAHRNAGSALRQLLERGLLVVDAPHGSPPGDSQYRTSGRFLQLFGVARLEDLPQMEDLSFK